MSVPLAMGIFLLWDASMIPRRRDAQVIDAIEAVIGACLIAWGLA